MCSGDSGCPSAQPCLTPADGLASFRSFLCSEFSEENVEFWVACEDYKKTKSPVKMEEKAKRIYEEFIQTEAPKEVGGCRVGTVLGGMGVPLADGCRAGCATAKGLVAAPVPCLQTQQPLSALAWLNLPGLSPRPFSGMEQMRRCHRPLTNAGLPSFSRSHRR